MGRYQLWIYGKDDEGRPLDQVILKAAEENGLSIIQYRQNEIECESTVNVILQSAVEAASKASRRQKIRNPGAYLASTYHRLVDNLLDQQTQWIPTDDAALENLANKFQKVS